MENKPNRKNVVAMVREWAKEPCERAGAYIWDVEYVREGAENYLRLLIDADGGIKLEQCELVTDAVNKMLDEADPISDQYIFEVGSPGIERALTETWQFERYIGEKIRVKFYKAVNGQKELVAPLEAVTDETITLGGTEIARRDVAKAKVYAEF